MKHVALIAAGAGLGLLTSASAHAMPIIDMHTSSQDKPLIQNVEFGCGPGWTPNRWGNCSRVEEAYGGYRPRGYGYGYGYGRRYYRDAPPPPPPYGYRPY